MGMIPLKKDRLAKDVTDDWDNFHRESKGFDSETSDNFSRILRAMMQVLYRLKLNRKTS
jgi:hypothetical protein